MLLPKDGDLKLLSCWRPITLLNTSYKFFAKVLQISLQRLLPDVINNGQSTFLLARYILNLVMVQNETIEWAKEFEQSLIMLK